MMHDDGEWRMKNAFSKAKAYNFFIVLILIRFHVEPVIIFFHCKSE